MVVKSKTTHALILAYWGRAGGGGGEHSDVACQFTNNTKVVCLSDSFFTIAYVKSKK